MYCFCTTLWLLGYIWEGIFLSQIGKIYKTDHQQIRKTGEIREDLLCAAQ